MKKGLSLLMMLGLCVLLSSCGIALATHSGIVENSAALSSNNFSYVATNVKGTATATYILGNGGLGHETLVAEAKENLLRQHPLKDGQALANVSVNFRTMNIVGIIYSTVTCTVSADVVQFK